MIKDFIEKNQPDIRKNEYITKKWNPKSKVQSLEV